MRANRIKISAIICLLVSLFIFLSCRKSTPSWDTQILAPIVNASLSINNLLTSSYIKSNPVDSSVSLVYTDSLYNLSIDTLLKIPDTVLNYYETDPIPSYTVTAGSVMFYAKPTTTSYPVEELNLLKEYYSRVF